jgi:hypothetical protein
MGIQGGFPLARAPQIMNSSQVLDDGRFSTKNNLHGWVLRVETFAL